MERKQHAHEEPELIRAHEQLQKKDAHTNAARHPSIVTMKSVVVTLV